ncbi:MAG: PIN domain-containing protein, partial [Rhodospirillaceae bacterium]
MDRFIAFLDANILYPGGLRDVILRLAAKNLFIPKWSPDVQREWQRALLKTKPHIGIENIAKINQNMTRAFPDALVTRYKKLEKGLDLPDKNDCHVLAAAIKAGAGVLVTNNTRDFPNRILYEYDLEAQKPDEFTDNLYNLYSSRVIETVKEHRLVACEEFPSVWKRL